MGRWIFRVLIIVVAVGAVLLGILAVGWWSLDQVRDRPRYQLAFQAIECPPPPGMARDTFLEQVRAAAEMPERFGLLDADLGPRLTHAFTLHPWVESVESVGIAPGRVVVRLQYRRPVLAVRTGNYLRAVDGRGAVLPLGTATANLPVYHGPAWPPPKRDFTLWDDLGVYVLAKLFGSSTQ